MGRGKLWVATSVGRSQWNQSNHNYTSFSIQPGQLAFHPGPQDQYSVIRFTNPIAGTYELASTFTGIDHDGPTTTDVHVLLNGVSLFSDLVNEYGVPHIFSTTLAINAGDRLDFEVGYGTNQNYYYDSTGIAAQMVMVPEPATITLLLGGTLFGFLLLYWRQKTIDRS